MDTVKYARVRVLCKKQDAYTVADKLGSMFNLMSHVERPQDAPNQYTLWVSIYTLVPYDLVSKRNDIDRLMASFGVTSLSSMVGVLAWSIEPHTEDMGKLLKMKNPTAVTRRASIMYVDDPESNYITHLEWFNIPDWPTPLQPMAAYILSPSFTKLELVIDTSHYTVTPLDYEGDTIELEDIAASMRTPDLDEGYPLMTDENRAKYQDMEARLARQEQQHIEDRQQLGPFGHYIPREDIP